MRKIYLTFCGPKGNRFGQEIIAEVKVALNSSQATLSLSTQEDIFREAINMAENMNLGTFDECVEALKKCKGDVNAACQMFFEKK